MPSSDTEKTYYYVDIELKNRQVIGWGTEPRSKVEVKLSHGFHRLFLSRGQYNKLVEQLESTRRT